MRSVELRRITAWIGLVIGLAALVLQFTITIPASMESGRTALASVIFYFSFFTILTNIFVVLIYLGALVRGQRWLTPFRLPWVRGMAAASITLVMGFYALVLADLWQPEGLFWVCDVALHYVAPILYLAWFALWNRSGTLTYRHITRMLSYPVAYLIYVMFRGEIVGEYPYPVLDVQAHGYLQVAINVAGLLIVLVALCAAAVAIDRRVRIPGDSM
ncbi:MAG: Pr6Pr family membrane protein [Hyphomicrobiaceae bacterium]|nr:Pr6Pr family membrane protein [Hyphomicrobiaceae bacterium]